MYTWIFTTFNKLENICTEAVGTKTSKERESSLRWNKQGTFFGCGSIFSTFQLVCSSFCWPCKGVYVCVWGGGSCSFIMIMIKSLPCDVLLQGNPTVQCTHCALLKNTIIEDSERHVTLEIFDDNFCWQLMGTTQATTHDDNSGQKFLMTIFRFLSVPR